MITGQKMSRKGRENIRKGLKKYYAEKRRAETVAPIEVVTVPASVVSPINTVRAVLEEIRHQANSTILRVEQLEAMLGWDQ